MTTLPNVARASAGALARWRHIYQAGCRTQLAVPPGVRTATGLMIAEDVTSEEVVMGLRGLARRVERRPVGDAKFAKYLYELSAERADGHLETLFFTYVSRPGNESLRREFAEQIMELTLAHLVLRDVTDEQYAKRINLMINLLREDPARFTPDWDLLIKSYFYGETINAPAILRRLEAYRQQPQYWNDAHELAAEFIRPTNHTVAELRMNGPLALVTPDANLLVAGLRLDAWVRSAAGLPDSPAVINLLRRIGFLLQSFTRH